MLDRAEIQCPLCGRAVRTSLQTMRHSGTVRCPAGHAITFDGKELDRGLRHVDREMDKLKRQLRRLR